MVSKASDDLPLPLTPVNTTSLFLGMRRSMFLRLCSRAPTISITSLVWTAAAAEGEVFLLAIVGDANVKQPAVVKVAESEFESSQVPAFTSSPQHSSPFTFRMSKGSSTVSIQWLQRYSLYSLFPLGLSSPVQSPAAVPVPVGFAALRPRHKGVATPSAPAALLHKCRNEQPSMQKLFTSTGMSQVELFILAKAFLSSHFPLAHVFAYITCSPAKESHSICRIKI